MTTRTKLNFAVGGASVCSPLVIFQKPLGISVLVLWLVLFPVWFLLLYLMFLYIKKLKAEKRMRLSPGSWIPWR